MLLFKYLIIYFFKKNPHRLYFTSLIIPTSIYPLISMLTQESSQTGYVALFFLQAVIKSNINSIEHCKL